MNITLISLYSTPMPIGLRCVSSCLKMAGHNVRLVSIPREIKNTHKGSVFNTFPEKIGEEYDKKTINELLELSKESDLIGISLSTNFFEDAAQVTKALKEQLKIPIVWGGIHPTVSPEECLEYADIVCRGEGEEAMTELAKKIEKKEDYRGVKNLCFKDQKGNVVINPVRPLIQNLDSIPFQDFDFKNQYIITEGKSHKFDKEAIFNKRSASVYQIMFTRGCPFGCTYCCNNFLNNLYSGQKIFRKRSIDNIIKELKTVKNNLSFVRFISFVDDNFLGLSLDEIKKFSEKYKKEIKTPFGLSGVHPVMVDREKIKHLVDAGLVYVQVGIQSGSKKGKEIYKRTYHNSQLLKAYEIIDEFKDRITARQYHVILDNPWETEEDLIKTLMLLSGLPVPYELVLFFLTFYPGTELYSLAEKDGFIGDKIKNIYHKNYRLYAPKSNLYLNNIFFLLSNSVELGKRISPRIMFLLTNKVFRKSGLSSLIYYCLLFRIKNYPPPKKLLESLKDA